MEKKPLFMRDQVTNQIAIIMGEDKPRLIKLLEEFSVALFFVGFLVLSASVWASLASYDSNWIKPFMQMAVFAKAFTTEILFPVKVPCALPLPLFSGKVAAGSPSPADDYVEKTLDLNELLVQKPAATFFVRAEGESMLGAGINPNDILVVDRSIKPVSGKIV
jgi:SOS-response transcriptional repressor LexA